MGHHALLRLGVDHRLAHRGAATPLGDFDDHFALLVVAEVVGELFAAASHHLLVDDPQSAVVLVQVLGAVLHENLIGLLLVLKDHPGGLPLAEAVEARVGDHHDAANVVEVLVEQLLGEALLAVNGIALVDDLLCIHGDIEHFLSRIFGEEPAGTEVVLVVDAADADGGRHDLEAISDGDVFVLQVLVVCLLVQSAQFLGLEWALRGQVLEGDSGSIDFRSQVVDYIGYRLCLLTVDGEANEVLDGDARRDLEQELVQISSLDVQDDHFEFKY